MQFIRYTHGGSTPQWGIWEGETIHALATHPAGEPSYADFANESYRRWLATALDMGAFGTVPAAEVNLLAPVPAPGKIVGVGLNYHDHATEQDVDPPDDPILFGKAPTSVTNPESPIVYPDGVEQVDYEVELGVIMGRTAHRVDVDDALNYVAGYTVVNDVTARDAQFADRQWFRGKGFDTFCPMGPTLTTDIDPHRLDVTLRVNGDRKQASNTNQLIFPVDELIQYISQAMTLRPGDVIATGTPGGVGIFRDPPNLLEPGDTVNATIDQIGTLMNPVTSPD